MKPPTLARRLFQMGRVSWYMIRVHGPRTYLRIAKAMVFGKHTLLEPRVMAKMKTVHGRYFIDIGANQGMYSLKLSHNFYKVYAYEPNPIFYDGLRGKANGHNVEVSPYAISDKD